jgi:hypothetical protein
LAVNHKRKPYEQFWHLQRGPFSKFEQTSRHHKLSELAMDALPELQVAPKANDNHSTRVITCVANAFIVTMGGRQHGF